MYIKYSEEPYQSNDNLREILNVSGEILGAFDKKTDKKGVKTKINIVLDENCIKVTRAMITVKFDKKRLMLFNLSKKKIIKKTNNQLIIENKEKLKKEISKQLLQKYPEKQIEGTLNEIYQEKIIEIDNCTTLEELNLIEI